MQAASLHIALDDLFQTRLVNWEDTALQTLDLFRNDIDTCYLISQICQTRSRHQSYITSPYNTDS